MKLFMRLITSLVTGLSLAWSVLAIGAVIAWLTAPAFLGVVFLAGSTLLIVKVCAGIAFVTGATVGLFSKPKSIVIIETERA